MQATALEKWMSKPVRRLTDGKIGRVWRRSNIVGWLDVNWVTGAITNMPRRGMVIISEEEYRVGQALYAEHGMNAFSPEIQRRARKFPPVPV